MRLSSYAEGPAGIRSSSQSKVRYAKFRGDRTAHFSKLPVLEDEVVLPLRDVL